VSPLVDMVLVGMVGTVGTAQVLAPGLVQVLVLADKAVADMAVADMAVVDTVLADSVALYQLCDVCFDCRHQCCYLFHRCLSCQQKLQMRSIVQRLQLKGASW